MRQHTPGIVLVVGLAVLLSGCAERKAQVSVQSALTALAHGLDAADAIVADRTATAAAVARAEVLEEFPGDVVAGLARYDEIMAPWTRTAVALRTTRSALLLAQGGVTAWVETGALPAAWAELCAGVEQAFGALLDMLEGLGIDVPDAVGALRPASGTICRIAGPWFRPER